MSLSSLPRGVFALLSTALAFISLSALFIVSPTPVTAQSNLITSHTFTITETGKYQITLQCKDGSIEYAIKGGNVLYTEGEYCPVSDYFTTFSTPLLNLPPQTYVISFYEESGDPVIGTTTSTREGDVTDIDSGILANGDFFQDSNWTYVGAHYKPDLGRTELGAANVLTLTSAQQQIQITEEGIYQYELYCYKNGTLIKINLVGEGLPIPGTGSGDFYCGDQSPTAWRKYSSPDFYLSQGTYTMTLQGNNRNSNLSLVDDILLVKKDSVGHLDTGLIRNGDFFKHDEWLWDNKNNYTITSGSFAFGAAKLFSSKKIRQGNIVIPNTGSYVLSIDCRSAIYSPTFVYKLESPGQSTTQATIACPHRSWETKLMPHTLTGGTYTLTLHSTYSQYSEVMVDDISLFPAALHDIDTGYIQNGDFVGPSAWALDGNVEYESKLGHTERGALYFPNTAGQIITQSLGSLEVMTLPFTVLIIVSAGRVL